MKTNSTKSQMRGISLIEILIVLAALTVITAIALPKPEKDSAKAEMQAAVENLQQAVYLARSTAMSKQTDVILHLVPGNTEESGKVTFSFANPKAGMDTSTLDHEYPFPSGIRLETSEPDVHFNSAGQVEYEARIALISNSDKDFIERLLIE